MARICDSLGDLAFPVLASTADVSLTFVFVPFASFLLHDISFISCFPLVYSRVVGTQTPQSNSTCALGAKSSWFFGTQDQASTFFNWHTIQIHERGFGSVWGEEKVVARTLCFFFLHLQRGGRMVGAEDFDLFPFLRKGWKEHRLA